MNTASNFEFDEDVFEDEYSGGYTFEEFKAEYPRYLDSLNSSIKNLYNTYVLIYRMRFMKLKKSPECLEIAQRCGFGMLMRHAMETIVTSIATENGVEVGGRSVYERLNVLKGQNIPGYDNSKKAILFKLLDLTNEIAHPHVIKKKQTTFDELRSFYDESFKEILDSHIVYIEELMKNSRAQDFGLPKEVLKSRKQAHKYLSVIKKQLDEFNVFNKVTSILARGCLVRQLTECSANLWGYNYGVVPTDVSTFEHQINLSNVLDSLSRISRANRKNAFGTSALTKEVVDNLYDLKAASNSLMHVDKFATGDLSKKGKVLSGLYNVIKSECSPHVMKKKLSEAASLSVGPKKRVREKSPALAAFLCGAFGWVGAHHFYTGSIAKGVIYIPFAGFIIRPTIDLYKILKGRFRNSKGVRLRKTALSSVIAFVFLAAHLFGLYSVGSKYITPDVIEKIKSFDPTKLISMQKCDDTVLENMEKIAVTECTASSYLVTSTAQYDSTLCTDGDYTTCWQDGVAGNGEGENLNFTFAGEEKISAVSIFNGKHTDEASYYDNARAAKLIIKVGNIQYPVSLEDIMQRQTFSFPVSKATNQVSVIIDSAYPGNAWEDLCISEIEFYKEK